MRQHHCTLTPAVVRRTAQQALSRVLPWQPLGRRVSVPCLLRLLLLVAALRSSLSAVVRRFRFGFSHETARQAVAANLRGAEAVGRLTDGLVAVLNSFPPRARKRVWDVAIDEHHCPFYGDRGTPGVRGGQKKHGSKYHYSYATAALIHRRHRYAVGLLPLTGPIKPHEVVAALLGQLSRHGLRVRGVVLDSGFDSGETLLLLQRRRLSYAVPLRRKGKGSNRRNACFALPAGAVTWVEWVTERTRRRVRTRVVVERRPGEQGARVCAFGGWSAGEQRRVRRRAGRARRAYRRRFGIETSYRQMNQGKGLTTKKDVAYRLLLVGLALLLRQAWVYLSGQLARAWGLRPTQWARALPLRRLLEWLAGALQARHPEEKVIELGRPLIPYEPTLET
jgi:hypothetical protein